MQVLKDEIKNKIISVAEDVFYQKGFEQSTMRQIASAVGISVSNLYLYYKNKEDIFYSVMDGFYRYLIKDIMHLLDHDDKEIISDVEIRKMVEKMILADQRKFIILAEKSQGTKYEGFKKQLIDLLYQHMKEQVNWELVQDTFILFILAKSFIEGIIEIAKDFKSKASLKYSIHTLFEYHKRGMEQLI